MTPEDKFLKAIEPALPVITKVCLAYSSSKEEYDDMRQDVMLNLWRGWDSFRGDSKLTTWVYRVALNTCFSELKKHKRRGETVSLETVLGLGDVDDETMANLKELYHMISQLTDSDRALIMMWLDDYSYAEIAEITGLGRNTVAVRLKRIKEKLIKMSNE